MALLEALQQTTPPGSINGPLTPPFSADAKISEPVAKILRVFKGCKNGYLPGPWTVHKVNSEQYEELRRQLKVEAELGEYVDDKVPYDYNPISSKLIIRMTTTLHDTFASKLAENYLLASDGGIRVVVGIDIEYKRSMEASISIWRLKMSLGDEGKPEGEVIQVLDNEVICFVASGGIIDIEQLFRDAGGNPIHSSSGLELPLDNFAVEELSSGLPDCSIVLDPKALCALLADAEEWNEKSTELQGVKPAPIKRKYRQRTPEEQLTISDEERVTEQERRIRRKTEQADMSYGEEGSWAEVSSQEAI